MQEDVCQNSRWYDRDTKMPDMLGFMQSLPENQQEELGVTLIQLANMIKKTRKEDEFSLSIGKERVLGLYKASNKRRWYDKNSVLMSAMNALGTLPEKDCSVIIEGFSQTLIEEENLNIQNNRQNIEQASDSGSAYLNQFKNKKQSC